MTSITNRSYEAATATHPPVERTWVYQPETAWFYSHHASMAFDNELARQWVRDHREGKQQIRQKPRSKGDHI
jgi:hypothetical protein